MGENNNHRSFLFSGTESTCNGFSDYDKEQSSGEQGMKYKKDFLFISLIKYFLDNAFSKRQNQIHLHESKENSVVLAKYLSTRTSRPTTSPFLSHFQNGQASKNTAAVFSSLRRNSATIEDEDFHFSNYLNNSSSKNKNQTAILDNYLGDFQNFTHRSNNGTSVRSDNNSNTELAKNLISDDEDNNAELIPDSEKAK